MEGDVERRTDVNFIGIRYHWNVKYLSIHIHCEVTPASKWLKDKRPTSSVDKLCSLNIAIVFDKGVW